MTRDTGNGGVKKKKTKKQCVISPKLFAPVPVSCQTSVKIPVRSEHDK